MTAFIATIASIASAVPSSAVASDRIAGSSRYATAVSISRHAFDGSNRPEHIFLASGDDLTAALLVGGSSNPILLLPPTCGRAPSDVQAEIERLAPNRVVVVSPPSEVCSQMVSAVAGQRAIVQLHDSDVVRQSVRMSQFKFANGAQRVYLYNGSSQADVVAAGMFKRGPVLPVLDGRLSTEVVNEIRRLAPSQVIAIGGLAAVTEDTHERAAAAASLDLDEVLSTGGTGRTSWRVAGRDRIETAVVISRAVFSRAGEATAVYLARSDNFVDAAAGASLSRGPVLLVPRCGALPATVRNEIARIGPTIVYALGGEGAICQSMLSAAASAA